jgi:tRNA (guanine37-N1)-methyltransferase
MEVPEVLRTGNFQKIKDWKKEKALEKTKLRRPDLLSDL